LKKVTNRKTIELKESIKFELIIFMDGEYTCWKDSEATMWADPKYPCETIQIGIAIFDILKENKLQTYSRYIRPKINWVLSDYCINLLKIPQKKIDDASDFCTISKEISILLQKYDNRSMVLCAWGNDWDCIADDAIRNAINDPFYSIPCLDLQRVSANIFGFGSKFVSREIISRKLDLPKSSNRHDAMGDALELKNIFYKLTQHTQKR